MSSSGDIRWVFFKDAQIAGNGKIGRSQEWPDLTPGDEMPVAHFLISCCVSSAVTGYGYPGTCDLTFSLK